MRKRTLPVFFYSWGINTLALLIASNTISGIQFDTVPGLITASFILSFLYSFVRPVLYILSVPFLLISLGFFTVIINATLLYWVGWLVKSFHVSGFIPAVFGAILVSIVNLSCDFFLLPKEYSKKIFIGKQTPKKNKPDTQSHPNGPVIDI